MPGIFCKFYAESRPNTQADEATFSFSFNVSGKLSDEMYMELSHKYEVERLELKTKIFEYKERLAKISEMEQNEDENYKANTRKGVDVEYIPTAKSA